MVATALRTSPRSTETDDQFHDGLEIDQVFCPACSTNLVMIDHSKNINSGISPAKLASPIAEVPFCFGCKAHVVCNAEQVQTLIQLGASGHTRIAHKGAILVATPSNIKLKRNNKAWPKSPKLTQEHELMIEYFQAATEEVEMSLIPDDDNLYLTITPSIVKQSDSTTEPHSPSSRKKIENSTEPQSPLKFITEQLISPSNPSSFRDDEAREPNDTIDEMDFLESHTDDDDIDRLFVEEEPKAMETIELIHCEGKTSSNNNEEFESTKATTSVQVQMVTTSANVSELRAPVSSDGSQSDGSSSEGGYEFDLPEYNVRREIATKALGAMMLQGYSLKEDICETCEMPLMDFEDKITCVVCPILKRRAALEKDNNHFEHSECPQQNQVFDDAPADEAKLGKREHEANGIQKEAQEAMEKAREALEKVDVARNEMMLDPKPSKSHDSHGQLDRVESVRSYDTNADVIHQEQWELLRSEGRLAKARRLVTGWKETGSLCAGKECHGFPLITSGAHIECMVCSGTGSGLDGIYSQSDDHPGTTKAFAEPEYHLNRQTEVSKKHSTTAHPASEPQSEFESKRKIVSKEIGKRLLKGWKLLDKACPYCVMPLMTNKKQVDEICVLCGLVGKKEEIGTEHEMQCARKVEQNLRNEESKKISLKDRLGVDTNTLRPDFAEGNVFQAGASTKTPSKCDPPEAHEVFGLSSPARRSIVIPDYETETGAKNRDPQASIAWPASLIRKDRREPEEQKPSYFKTSDIKDEGKDGKDNLADSLKQNDKQESSILTLEIPTTFDFGDEAGLRDLIEAAKTSDDFEECSLLGVRRPQPSPGMEHAKLPGLHSPPSVYSRYSHGSRPPITPETAPRPKGSGLIYCSSRDAISFSTSNDSPSTRVDKIGGSEDDRRTPKLVQTIKNETKRNFMPPRPTMSTLSDAVGSGTCYDAIALHELSLSFEELKGTGSGVQSVESEALDALMNRIEDTKHKLQKGNTHVDTDLRELIDGLAKTAYDMEMIERSKN